MFTITDSPISLSKESHSWKIDVNLEEGGKISFVTDGLSLHVAGELNRVNANASKTLQNMPWKENAFIKAKIIDPSANKMFFSTKKFQSFINASCVRPVLQMSVPLFPNFPIASFIDPSVLLTLCSFYEKGNDSEKILAMESMRTYIETVLANRKLHAYATLLSFEILFSEKVEGIFNTKYTGLYQKDGHSVTVTGILAKDLSFTVSVAVRSDEKKRTFILTDNYGNIDRSSLLLAIKSLNGLDTIQVSSKGTEHLPYQIRKRTFAVEGENFSKIITVENPSDFFKSGAFYVFNPGSMQIEEIFPPAEAVQIIAEDIYKLVFENFHDEEAAEKKDEK